MQTSKILKTNVIVEEFNLPNLKKAKKTLEKMEPLLVSNGIYLGSAFIRKSKKEKLC